MNPDSPAAVLELLPAQVLRLRAASGVTITCDGGTLWVTQEGMARDYFLSAGESLCVASSGVTLAEAVGGAAARLTLRRPSCAESRNQNVSGASGVLIAGECNTDAVYL